MWAVSFRDKQNQRFNVRPLDLVRTAQGIGLDRSAQKGSPDQAQAQWLLSELLWRPPDLHLPSSIPPLALSNGSNLVPELQVCCYDIHAHQKTLRGLSLASLAGLEGFVVPQRGVAEPLVKIDLQSRPWCVCRATSFHPNLGCKLLHGVATSRVRNTNRHEHGSNRGLPHLVMERVLGLDDVAIIHFQPVVVDHGRGRRQSDLAHDGMATDLPPVFSWKG